METLQKILSNTGVKKKPKKTNSMQPLSLNQTPIPQQTPLTQNTPPFYGIQQPMPQYPIQAQEQIPVYEQQPTTENTSQKTAGEKDKKPEPVEKDYPEFLLFRLNSLKKYTEENFSEVYDKINELESKIDELKKEDIESLKKSLMKLYDVIDKMNTALAEYIVKKVTDITTPLNMEVEQLKSTINELTLTVQGLGVKLTTLTQVIENQAFRIQTLEYSVQKLSEENRELKKRIKSLENIKFIGIDFVEPELEFSYYIDSYQDPHPQIIVIENKEEKETIEPENTVKTDDEFNIDELVNTSEEVTEELLNNYYSSIEHTENTISETITPTSKPEEKEDFITMSLVSDEIPPFTSEVTMEAEDFNKVQLEEIVHELKELNERGFTILTL